MGLTDRLKERKDRMSRRRFILILLILLYFMVAAYFLPILKGLSRNGQVMIIGQEQKQRGLPVRERKRKVLQHWKNSVLLLK